MDITASMIKERLIAQGCRMLREYNKTDAPLIGPKLFDGIISPNYLTICCCRDLKELVPKELRPLPEESNYVICISQELFYIVDDFSLPIILNRVIDAFQYYHSYENELMQAVYEGTDIQGLLDMAEPYLNNPTFIANWHGEVFAFTKSFADQHFRPSWTHIVTKRRLPLSSVQVLLDSPHYQEVTQCSKAAIFEFPEKSFTCIIGKVDRTLDYHLYIQIMQHKTAVTETSRIMAQTFLHALSKIRHPKEATTLSELFYDLLSEKSVDPEKINWVLVTLGWVKNTRFLLLYFWNKDGLLTASALCGELKNLFTGGHTFIWRDKPIMLIRESDFTCAQEQITQVARALSFTCGVSMPFTDWNTLSVQFQQAEVAIRYRPKESRIAFCADHVWAYLKEQLLDVLNIKQLYHPSIITLANFDKNKGSQLLYTLYVYLTNERNLSTSANILYIHRNTLLYRLNRINDLVTVDLNNPDVRAHIMLSCQMMEHAKGLDTDVIT